MNNDPRRSTWDRPRQSQWSIVIKMAAWFLGVSCVWVVAWLGLMLFTLAWSRIRHDWRDIFFLLAAFVPVWYFAITFSLLGAGIARDSTRLKFFAGLLLGFIAVVFFVLSWAVDTYMKY